MRFSLVSAALGGMGTVALAQYNAQIQTYNIAQSINVMTDTSRTLIPSAQQMNVTNMDRYRAKTGPWFVRSLSLSLSQCPFFSSSLELL